MEKGQITVQLEIGKFPIARWKLVHGAHKWCLVILVHAILISEVLQRQANVDLCSKVTKHVEERNSAPAVASMGSVEVRMTIAKAVIVTQGHAQHRGYPARGPPARCCTVSTHI